MANSAVGSGFESGDLSVHAVIGPALYRVRRIDARSGFNPLDVKFNDDPSIEMDHVRAMPRISAILILLISLQSMCLSPASAQSLPSPDEGRQNYTLRLPVDEVVVTFHASDIQGKSVNDIQEGEIQLWDNGLPPRRIVSFDRLLDRPLRIGILIDSSESMAGTLELNKMVAARYIQGVFRSKSDQAFVEDFGGTSETSQPWSNASSSIQQGIQAVRIGNMNHVRGTALFDAVFRACFYGFGKSDPTATGNVILLFSDGEDNSGQTTLLEALRACQQTNTAIYAFHVPPGPDESSTGPKNLRDLTSGNGGRMFRVDKSEAAIWDDVKAVESESRNQYRLVYNPAKLMRDGSFHEILIQPPDRVKRIEVRTGYYAPAK